MENSEVTDEVTDEVAEVVNEDEGEGSLCTEAETSTKAGEEALNSSDCSKDPALADTKGSGKKSKKSKQNWKNRYGKQKQKCAPAQDAPENNLNRRPFHLNYKFRPGRKRTQSFSTVSKFFLPYKRPRKETFIPPTKFLLGGNISDPLNLNSLQDEDINRAMNAVTPKSSPLPTPPRHRAKIDVIIPPDIRDPLNLLNPVDNAEYEKQLETKKPRRPRKKGRSKRRSSEGTNVPTGSPTQASPVKEESSAPTEIPVVQIEEPDTPVPSTSTAVAKDLKLDLTHARLGIKRTNSESEGCTKNKDSKKLRRMDSLDKIVSPVIPQPGAWMRVHTHGGGHATRGGRGGPGGNKARPPLPRTSFTAEPPAVARMPKFRPQDQRYQYGNYDRYYGYRNLDAMMDIRLKVFGGNRHLFNNKDVLDIGCNVGHISIAVARDFGAKSVVGIDIDKILIARARKNIRDFIIIPPVPQSPPKEKPNDESADDPSHYVSSTTDTKMETVDEGETLNRSVSVTDIPSAAGSEAVAMATEETDNPADVTESLPLPPSRQPRRCKRNRRSHHRQGHDTHKFYFPISCPVLYGPAEVMGYPLETGTLGYPQNIKFKQANYILRDENLINAEPSQFDLIMCLSVTKWFHLNWGDSGLKLAFKRMFTQLRPGGKLILEAQSWASYKKKKKLTETIYRNFSSIEFFPNKFREYLLSPEVGFSKCCVLGVPQHLSKGFRRPIHLYIKGDFTPSKVEWSDTYAPSSHHQPDAGIENQPKKVYTNVLTSHYLPNSSRWSGNNTPFNGAATPYSLQNDAVNIESPFYNPGSDSYLPSYTCSGYPKPVYASLSSPQSDSGGTPVHSSDGGIVSISSPASPFLEPSPGNSTTPSHPFTPSHSASCDMQMNKKKVYASLPSPQEEASGRGHPVYSPSVAGPSRQGAASGRSPLHTGSTLCPLPELADLDNNTNSNDSLQAKMQAEHFTPMVSPSGDLQNSVDLSSSPKELSNDATE